jgi:hypothetical protein
VTVKKKTKKTIEKGPFKPGNQLWKLRSSHGRKPIFSSPEELWEAAVDYFEWVTKHPLKAAELVKYQGKAKIKNLPKMRAMTLKGLCLFLDLPHSTWQDYTAKDDFSAVTTRIEDIIYEQKFTGAAADLLNPNIIARDLGLADKKEVSGPDGDAIEIDDITRNELARRVAFLFNKAIHEGEKKGTKT